MEGRARFVPRRVGQLTNELAAIPWPDTASAEAYRSWANLVSALYHFQFHGREQAIVEAWESAAVDPDAVRTVTDELAVLLDNANYVEVTMEELQDAMVRESLIPLRLKVDIGDYNQLLVFRRGSRHETVDVSRWKGLRTEERTITVDDRVIVLTQVKPLAWFEEHGIDPAERNLIPDHISLKEFKDVPRADIEMLLPSTRVRYRPIDAVLVGLPAVVSGIVVLATKLLPTLGLMFVLVGAWLGVRDDEPRLDQGALVALFGGVVALGGFLLRQWNKLKNRRLKYMKTMSEALYFRTLADGPGVLHTLLSSAEQQEVTEVLLAYRFLLAAPEGLSAEDLDTSVEHWLGETCQRDIDFEVGDALDKLKSFDLVEGEEVLRARPMPDALARLDRRWDDLFRHRSDGAVAQVTKGPDPTESSAG